MDEKYVMSPLVIDALTEAGNIGAGHAATSLSKLLGEHIMNHVTKSVVVPIEDVPDTLGGGDKIVAGIYTTFAGELTGGILMLFPESSANTISKVLLNCEITGAQLTDLQNSMMSEIGNICLCWYLSAIAKMVNTEIIPTPPVTAYDMIEAAIDLPLIELGKVADTAMIIMTEFRGEIHAIEGIFLMLLEPDSLKEMARRLGVA